MTAVARPTWALGRPRPPVKRKGRRAWVLAERGAGRRRNIKALKAEMCSARRKCAEMVRMTLLVQIKRKGSLVVIGGVEVL